MGSNGFKADSRGEVPTLTGAGIIIPEAMLDFSAVDGDTLAAAAARREAAGAAVAACLSSDRGLREDLLSGLALFVLAATQRGADEVTGPEGLSVKGVKGAAEAGHAGHGVHAGHGMQTVEKALAIVADLEGRVKEQAEKVLTLCSGVGEDLPECSGMCDKEISGALPETLPSDLMQHEAGRSLQLGLLPLQVCFTIQYNRFHSSVNIARCRN